MTAPSRENLEDASSQLAELSVWLEELDAELDSHLAQLSQPARHSDSMPL
jgi:hypothetical protein